MKYRTITAAILTISFSPSLFADSIENCNDRKMLTEMAMSVRDALKSGKSEDSLLQWAGEIESRGIRAAAYKAIEGYTFFQAPASTSQAVSVMQYVCKKEYRP